MAWPLPRRWPGEPVRTGAGRAATRPRRAATGSRTLARVSTGGFRYGAPAGTSEDVAVVRAIYDAFAARDVEAALPLVADEFELLPSGTAGRVGRTVPYRGPDGLREYLADVQRVWDDLVLVADDIRAVAGSVVVFGHVRGARAARTSRSSAACCGRGGSWTARPSRSGSTTSAPDAQAIRTTSSRRVPRGASKATWSPTLRARQRPGHRRIHAEPALLGVGLVRGDERVGGLAAGLDVADGHRGAERRAVAAGRGRLHDDRVAALVLQPQDLASPGAPGRPWRRGTPRSP